MKYEYIDDIPQEYLSVIIRLQEQGIISESDCLEQPLSDEALYLLKLLARKGLV